MPIKQKKAAMEMSVGTIVTIVLLMGVLVLGIFLIQRIFTSAKGAIDLTDQQLRNEINKLFSEESMLSIYPGTRLIEIKQENIDGVGIGIRNLLSGTTGTILFSYEVVVADTEAELSKNCDISVETAENWMRGRAETDIPIASGDFASPKVLFEIPVGSPLCTIKYRVNVKVNTGTGYESYATDSFFIKIRAK